jgi:hypothetical protein
MITFHRPRDVDAAVDEQDYREERCRHEMEDGVAHVVGEKQQPHRWPAVQQPPHPGRYQNGHGQDRVPERPVRSLPRMVSMDGGVVGWPHPLTTRTENSTETRPRTRPTPMSWV